jgi:hypothetical protein
MVRHRLVRELLHVVVNITPLFAVALELLHVVVNITPLFAVALELGHRCVE